MPKFILDLPSEAQSVAAGNTSVSIPMYGVASGPVTAAHPAHLVTEVDQNLRFPQGFTRPRHYMLAADAPNGDLIIEPGRTTRVWHFANDGMTYADIETAEGLSPGTVNQDWLYNQTTSGLTVSPARYGETPALALLHTATDNAIQTDLSYAARNADPAGRQSSWWFLFKGGETFAPWREPGDRDNDVSGESALHPIVYGRYGPGSDMAFISDANYTGPGVAGLHGHSFYVRQGLRCDFSDISSPAGRVPPNPETDPYDGRNYFLTDTCDIRDTKALKTSNWNFFSRRAYTYRKVRGLDVQRLEPISSFVEGKWDNPNATRYEPLYLDRVDYLLITGCFFDGNGWDIGKKFDGWREDLGINATSDPNLPVTNGQPPCAYNHNVYLQNTQHVSFVQNVLSRASDSAIQLRGGGYVFLTMCMENSIAFQIVEDGLQPENASIDNYTEVVDTIAMGAGGRTKMVSAYSNFAWNGATDWSFSHDTRYSTFECNATFRGAIAAHFRDPNNPAEDNKFPANDNNFRLDLEDFRNRFWKTGPDNVVKYNWVNSARDYNISALNTATMNAATFGGWLDDIQQVPLGTNTTWDACDYLRTLGNDAGLQAKNIWNFLAPAYGFTAYNRTTPTTLTFVPDTGSNGFRWDDPYNWTGNGWAGMVNGDSVDLDGNFVMHYTDYCELTNLNMGGNGSLEIWGGKTRVTGDFGGGGTVTLRAAGQLHLEGTSSSGSKLVNAHGGRLLIGGTITDHLSIAAQVDNSDLRRANSKSHVAEVVIDEGGALTIASGHTFTLTGRNIFAGFDGDAGRAASLTVASGGTLAFVAGSDEEGGTVIPQIAEFYSGKYGLDANNRIKTPNVASSVTLASGSTVTVDATGLAPGSYDLIDVDTLADNGATLPAGVAVSGNRLVLTVG
jgi:hypothetical protein